MESRISVGRKYYSNFQGHGILSKNIPSSLIRTEEAEENYSFYNKSICVSLLKIEVFLQIIYFIGILEWKFIMNRMWWSLKPGILCYVQHKDLNNLLQTSQET